MLPTSKSVPCDQCHERRVKCNSLSSQSCESCTRSSLKCTRLLVRRKRGPKTSTRLSKNRLSLAGNISGDGVPQNDENNGSGLLSLALKSPISAGYNPRASRRSLPANMTVNELATTILNADSFPVANERSLHSPSSNFASPHYSPSLVRPSVWLPQPAVTPSDPYPWTSDDSDAGFAARGADGNSTLDRVALALATGLPLRYGSELLRSIDAYFHHTHHVLIVLHETSILTTLTYPSEMTILQRSLFLSICAVAKLKSWCTGDFQNRLAKEVGCTFLERALQLSSSIEYMEDTSPMTVVVSYLLHLCYACLNKPKSARTFMQEAICRALDLGLHLPRAKEQDESVERVCARRTLALLYVTERATVVLNDCAAVLLRDPPPIPATVFSEEDTACLNGFDCLFQLFALLDVEVVEYWCAGQLKHETQRDSLHVVLSEMQGHLSTIVFTHISLSDEQKADVLVTQEWLRLICWQISMRLGYLSSQAAQDCFSYDYPIKIASKTCVVLESIPDAALRAHHFSIYCKLFEIAYSLMDVLTLAGRQTGTEGRHELQTLFRYLSTSPIKEMRFARILMEKERNYSVDDTISQSAKQNSPRT